jgi:phosphatidylglycerol:prolipoprotein diacylglycerol transferase
MELTHVYGSFERYVGTVHPTFLYESLWNLLGFILINALYRRRKFDGQITLMYFAWYGFGRMFIEGLRADSLYVGPFRISQVIGFLTFIAAATLIIVFWNKGKLYESASYKGESAVKETAAFGEHEDESGEKEEALYIEDASETESKKASIIKEDCIAKQDCVTKEKSITKETVSQKKKSSKKENKN